MNNKINRVVIVGGGTAGWLAAGTIAAEHRIGQTANQHPDGFQLTLIESPDIASIGVGEGTWPSMRCTLQKMGISETDFIRECGASFKQGTQFKGWITGSDDVYTHPFTVPQGYHETNLAPHWQSIRDQVKFANAVCPQGALFDQQLAPKQISTPEYALNVNYGYHLNAVKFADFLSKHCVEKLAVKHVKASVTAVNSADNGDIASVSTDTSGDIYGDLFIDCSGARSLLLGEHFKVPYCAKHEFLFNNMAIAAQVPYPSPEDPIQSCTLSTAQSAGWIWDIGLPERRGIGHTYSNAHSSEQRATDELISYIASTVGAKAAEDVVLRTIQFNPGHRAEFWHKNCVGMGMAAGFIEPLEASALVLIELSAAMIAEQLPANRTVMDQVAKRFNDKFRYRWDRIIDFLKLHYILTQRTDTAYWRDNCVASSIPDSLKGLMELWRYQSPWHRDTGHVDEMFPSASFQYVLYGMDFVTEEPSTLRRSHLQASRVAGTLFQENAQRTEQLLASLPSNRELINKVQTFGFQKI